MGKTVDSREPGALIRDTDWSTSLLGPAATWPHSLKTIVGMIVHARHPMFVCWGPDLATIYNDATRRITGGHPWALGRPAREVWPEIWGGIEPLAGDALAGHPTSSDALMLCMERDGLSDEVYVTFSFSPIRDESGVVVGVFGDCTDPTSTVIGKRRQREGDSHRLGRDDGVSSDGRGP